MALHEVLRALGEITTFSLAQSFITGHFDTCFPANSRTLALLINQSEKAERQIKANSLLREMTTREVTRNILAGVSPLSNFFNLRFLTAFLVHRFSAPEALTSRRLRPR